MALAVLYVPDSLGSGVDAYPGRDHLEPRNRTERIASSRNLTEKIIRPPIKSFNENRRRVIRSALRDWVRGLETWNYLLSWAFKGERKDYCIGGYAFSGMDNGLQVQRAPPKD